MTPAALLTESGLVTSIVDYYYYMCRGAVLPVLPTIWGDYGNAFIVVVRKVQDASKLFVLAAKNAANTEF